MLSPRPRRVRPGLRFLALSLALAATVRAAPPNDTPSVYESSAPAAPAGAIDRGVLARLAQLGIEPARPCSDAVFVRRVHLDVIGRLPTAAEARAFLDDPAPAKRSALIDALLARDEYADYWAMKWSDLLRVKAEYPVNLWPNAAQAYHRWIHASLHENLPFDRFARTLLTASGSNFRSGPANFYRAVQSKDPRALARTAALTFLGVRTETWPAEKLDGLAACFSQVGYKATGEWKEEIVFWDTTKPLPPSRTATMPDGTRLALGADRDPREVFADWLIRPENPWFTRAIANRVWSWLLGRGVVHEADDFRPDNPPANPALLALLERELVAARYDVKQLFRLILNSRTYQQSCVPRSDRPEAAGNFACYPLRRLEAEVLIDAINDLTGTTEKYSSAIPEPYTYVPGDVRSVELPDGSITSSFLEMFGRPPRDSGFESERNNRITATQRLHLLNSSHLRRKIEEGPKLAALLRDAQGKPREAIDALYLTILSRPPTDAERSAVRRHAQSAGLRGRDAALDLAWALINSAEFLHRH